MRGKDSLTSSGEYLKGFQTSRLLRVSPLVGTKKDEGRRVGRYDTDDRYGQIYGKQKHGRHSGISIRRLSMCGSSEQLH